MQTVEEFLQQGGQIKVIPRGETGFLPDGTVKPRQDRKYNIVPNNIFPKRRKSSET